MRLMTCLFAALLLAFGGTARAERAVDVALVLLTDVSNSIDDHEYALVKEGYRAAFSDPEVIAAIQGSYGGVAVAYVEFSGAHEVTLVRGWDHLTDAASSQAFGAAVASAPRSSAGNTALAASLKQAVRLLKEGGFGAARLVIDVASDHPGDSGRSAPIRDAAVADGITINALPIIGQHPAGTIDGRLTYTSAQWGWGGTAAFYQRDVIGGAGAFMVEAQNYDSFAAALKRKLLLELMISQNDRLQ